MALIPCGSKLFLMEEWKMKRTLALLLTFIMLISFVPVVSFGADDITVYISVAENGGLVCDKNGEQVAAREIVLGNENPTLNDAFLKLHEDYYNTAAETGYVTSGDWITTFWGKSASYAGYMNNHSYAMGISDPVADGSYIVFYFYQDKDNWSDKYVKFENTFVSKEGGEKIELTLTDGTNNAVSDATITVNGTRMNGIFTDENGKADIYLAKEGEYIISVASDSVKFVPPVCVATVTSNDESIEEILQEDMDALELSSIATENIELPLVGLSGKSLIEWKTTDDTVITSEGEVKKSSEEKNVTLTAKLTYGGEYRERKFEISVPALTDSDILKEAGKYLEQTEIAPVEWNDTYTSSGDTNIKSAINRFLSSVVNGVEATAVISSENEEVISLDGEIKYASAKKVFNITVKLKKNDEEKTVTVKVNIPKHAETRQNIMNTAADKLGNVILKDNTDFNNITGDFNFTSITSALGYYVQAEWKIPENGKAYLDRYGDVKRPEYGNEDVSFTLECKLTWYSLMESYMPSGYVGSTPADKTVSYDITIKAITEEEYNNSKNKVDEALNNFNTDLITYFSNKEKANTTAVIGDLLLPSVDGFSTTTEWVSQNTDIIATPSYKTGRARVTRPDTNSEDITVKLTLKISENGYTNTKDISVTVKALTEEEITAANNNVKFVADSLNFDVIKNTNISATSVKNTLNIYKSATIKDGEISWSKTASPSTGYKIEWTYPSQIIGTYGAITRPDENTKVTLKAKVTDVERAYTSAFETTIDITVLEKDSVSVEETLLANIAKKYTSDSDDWKLLDMAAFAELIKNSADKSTDDAKQNYINTVVSKLNSGEIDADEKELAKAIITLTAIGINSEKLYPVNSNTSISAVEKLKNITTNSLSAWTAPYVIMALSQKNYDSEKVSYLIDEILKLQKEDGRFEEYGYIIDTTANMIACLSLYYDKNENVKAAIDKAITYLSSVQKEDGTFDAYGYGADTNTTSMVIVALASVGINPDTDERFIKNGISVYDTLFKYTLDDLSGFGYQDKTFNDYSTEQAFRALIAAVNVINSNKAYNIYDFSKNTLEPGRATSIGTVVTPSLPDTDDTISVVFTLKGKTNSYWISNKVLTLKKGSTIYHALTEACDSAGITYKGAEDGYVYEMTKGSETLTEFGDGANSGWLYKVNGEVPNIGILEYELENNDRIVFFYTTDWETVSGVTISGTQKEEEVTSTNVKNQIAKLKDVTLEDEEKINKLLEDYKKLSEKEKKKVNNYEELLKAKERIEELKFEKERAEVLSNITDVSSHWAEDSISYVVKKGYMNGTGKETFAPEENLTREMLVTVLYRVAGNPETSGEIKFSDVDEEWCKDAVIWASENNIVKGINDNDFGCGVDMTREEFVTMLMRFSLGKAEESKNLEQFEDESEISDWAYDAFKWACDKGIIMGKENNKIAPKDKITRAEAATLIQRYIELEK